MMNKSILVINTPKNCGECELNSLVFGCHFGYELKDCLLRKLPDKIDCFEEVENIINQKLNKKETDKKIDKIRNYSEGYNDCLDEILSGNNE